MSNFGPLLRFGQTKSQRQPKKIPKIKFQKCPKNCLKNCPEKLPKKLPWKITQKIALKNCHKKLSQKIVPITKCKTTQVFKNISEWFWVVILVFFFRSGQTKRLLSIKKQHKKVQKKMSKSIFRLFKATYIPLGSLTTQKSIYHCFHFLSHNNRYIIEIYSLHLKSEKKAIMKVIFMLSQCLIILSCCKKRLSSLAD